MLASMIALTHMLTLCCDEFCPLDKNLDISFIPSVKYRHFSQFSNIFVFLFRLSLESEYLLSIKPHHKQKQEGEMVRRSQRDDRAVRAAVKTLHLDTPDLIWMGVLVSISCLAFPGVGILIGIMNGATMEPAVILKLVDHRHPEKCTDSSPRLYLGFKYQTDKKNT